MNIGVVVIGRNEGERLRRCLESINTLNEVAIVYVDSGSSDGSVELANSKQVTVVELDLSTPFSAARARNEGFTYLLKNHPEIQYVQFIDGDCTLAPGWLDAAADTLKVQTDCAAVVGHLQESNPGASVYNRLCALEWKSPAGEMTNYGALGGISMMRTEVFKRLGGFNPKVIAGEDSELGVRMALAGYKVIKIDHPMAMHDANMLHFSQWWKRAVRGGHAIGQRAFLNGQSSVMDCVRERKSAWFWGIGVPTLILLALVPTSGWSLLLLAGYPVLGARVYRYRVGRDDSQQDALLYAFFIILGKFAEGIGLLKFYINRMRARYEIIEYK
ncbi:MAG: glycosyltransferase family 2 protein [Gammaproteobacteria bacterium]|nr:glycosyltransferase family 2 protein [Gammaproteobacteria bacterium]